MSAPALCQVAISATHLLRSHHWYRRALGFLAGGSLRHRDVDGPAPVSDLPESSFDVWCLVDRQEHVQIEMFEFQRPRMRLLPVDWRPSDIGYSTIGVHVADFDEAIARLMRTSGRLITPPLGAPGQRRVCLRDPDGVLLELMEDDPGSASADAQRPGVPLAMRFVTLSVPDLDRARRFWVDAVGLLDAGFTLHDPGHEALWDLDGAARESSVLQAGDVYVELVQYTTPGPRARPPGYLPSDQGIFNVALGFPTRDQLLASYDCIASRGYRFNSEPWTLASVATVVYATDDQGFSVELLHVEPGAEERMGFVPATSQVDNPA